MTLLLLRIGPGTAVPPAAPVNTTVPVISGVTQVGSTLTTTDGIWTGSPMPTYAYQWKRGGVNITGATASSYLLVTADLAATITVTVMATNASGSANAISAGVGPITAVPVVYVTWDTATVTNVTLSGGNLIATSTGGSSSDQGARVATGAQKTSGKYYFEVTMTTLTGVPAAGVGIATPSSTYPNMTNNATVGVMTYTRGAGVYANGVGQGINNGFRANGDVVGMAVDLDNRKMWFRVTGSSNWNASGTDNPATNTGGVAIPSGSMVPFATMAASSTVYTANFGASAFSGAVPSGFTSGWPT